MVSTMLNCWIVGCVVLVVVVVAFVAVIAELLHFLLWVDVGLLLTVALQVLYTFSGLVAHSSILYVTVSGRTSPFYVSMAPCVALSTRSL